MFQMAKKVKAKPVSRWSRFKNMDVLVLITVFFLNVFGLVMIYSASSYSNSTSLLIKQAIAVGGGIVLMLGTVFVGHTILKKLWWLIYGVAVIFLALVKTSLGVESHGARRWIHFPGIPFNIQPAEIAKIAVIITTALMICWMGNEIRNIWKVMIACGILAGPLALEIILFTKNMSTTIILCGIVGLMFFLASPCYKDYLIIAGIAVGLAAVFILISLFTDWAGFRGSRITAWLNPEEYGQETGYQTKQALYAIGSGGIGGKGLGQSMQKLNYLPEAQNDMIFSIICEEWGLFGAFTIMFVFAVLIWRIALIAMRAKSLFSSMLACGVLAHIALQVILNIAVVTNSVPNTGVSLPFISYGGSSVLCLLIEIGIVLSVNCETKEKNRDEIEKRTKEYDDGNRTMPNT